MARMMTREEIREFKAACLVTLGSLQPAVLNLTAELKRQNMQMLDHETFIISEFRRLTRSIEDLVVKIDSITRTIERLS